jgi:hypothetical protein
MHHIDYGLGVLCAGARRNQSAAPIEPVVIYQRLLAMAIPRHTKFDRFTKSAARWPGRDAAY